jgi:pimeloyl-ACP methyl ester carboxylesterase
MSPTIPLQKIYPQLTQLGLFLIAARGRGRRSHSVLHRGDRVAWRFPNELPIAGKPADVYATLVKTHAALAASTYPKLLFAAEPGTLVSPALAESLARELHDCRLVKLGSGVHLLQEDHPETIGRSVAAFISEVVARSVLGARHLSAK